MAAVDRRGFPVPNLPERLDNVTIQFDLTKLGIEDAALPAVWNAVVSA
ncbi:hypothetical protein [Robbsia andropogonis]|nr:hypothetical protein [Robbsia andropogonis]